MPLSPFTAYIARGPTYFVQWDEPSLRRTSTILEFKSKGRRKKIGKMRDVISDHFLMLWILSVLGLLGGSGPGFLNKIGDFGGTK